MFKKRIADNHGVSPAAQVMGENIQAKRIYLIHQVIRVRI
jgi:hypothetical protein